MGFMNETIIESILKCFCSWQRPYYSCNFKGTNPSQHLIYAFLSLSWESDHKKRYYYMCMQDEAFIVQNVLKGGTSKPLEIDSTLGLKNAPS